MQASDSDQGEGSSDQSRSRRLRSAGLRAAPLLAAGAIGAGVAVAIAFAAGLDGGSTTVVREVAPAAGTDQTEPAAFAPKNGSLTVAEIYRRTASGVVRVTPMGNVSSVDPFDPFAPPQQGEQPLGTGSGFVIDTEGHILTNFHVVQGAQEVHVTFSGREPVVAKVVGTDPSTDIALLKVDLPARALTPLPLGTSKEVQVGDDVVAIGNALALEGGLSVTRGIISGPPRPGSEIGTALETVLQTDAAINPGNSGGPLVDANGCVIGINTAVASGTGTQPAQNVGFAIPISYAKPVVDDIKAGRKPAFLGVGTTDLTPELKTQLGVNVDDGAVVEDVTSGSPADDAGMKRGDVIVQIGDTQIKDGGDVATAVRKHHPDEKVTVTYVRGSDRKTAEVTLVERPDAG
jgi:S1-C subfamily serine protease